MSGARRAPLPGNRHRLRAVTLARAPRPLLRSAAVPPSHPYAEFLRSPGSPGAFGAMLDEYARAAVDLCARVESFDDATFSGERPSPDPDCRSPRLVSEHVAFAGVGYANYLLRMQGIPVP